MLHGKIPPDALKSRVFKHLGTGHPSIILGPALGQDASLIRVGDRIIVASTDPITGSVEDIGWLAVHVNANDIATFGVEPKWFLNSIMLPTGSTEEDLEKIMIQIDEAARSLGITVAGGHTEVTDEIQKPIIAGFMIGETTDDNYVTSEGAQPGDALIMTKSVAIEGTAILASEGHDFLRNELGYQLLDEAIALRNQISVVMDGITAFKTGFVTAMHDPTEGGLANGIHEICDASKVGCSIVQEQIPVEESTRALCQLLEIDPLQLISSGTMLITCEARNAQKILDALRHNGIEAAVIGTIEKDFTKRIISLQEKESTLIRPETDALWDGLKRITS